MADVLTDYLDELMADLLDGAATAPTTYYVAWGTGAGTAAKTDTTLFTEASEARVAMSESQPSVKQNQLVGTIVANGTKVITNVGIFDAITGGNMVAKSDFGGISVDAGDSLQITAQINHG